MGWIQKRMDFVHLVRVCHSYGTQFKVLTKKCVGHGTHTHIKIQMDTMQGWKSIACLSKHRSMTYQPGQQNLPCKIAERDSAKDASIHTLILHLVGGLNPSEKYKSQLRWLFPIYGNIKFVFQTTNQITIIFSLLLVYSLWKPRLYNHHY